MRIVLLPRFGIPRRQVEIRNGRSIIDKDLNWRAVPFSTRQIIISSAPCPKRLAKIAPLSPLTTKSENFTCGTVHSNKLPTGLTSWCASVSLCQVTIIRVTPCCVIIDDYTEMQLGMELKRVGEPAGDPVEGSDVTLTCTVSSFNPSRLAWSYYGHEYRANSTKPKLVRGDPKLNSVNSSTIRSVLQRNGAIKQPKGRFHFIHHLNYLHSNSMGINRCRYNYHIGKKMGRFILPHESTDPH